jgi:hypothetical protein
MKLKPGLVVHVVEDLEGAVELRAGARGLESIL